MEDCIDEVVGGLSNGDAGNELRHRWNSIDKLHAALCGPFGLNGQESHAIANVIGPAVLIKLASMSSCFPALVHDEQMFSFPSLRLGRQILLHQVALVQSVERAGFQLPFHRRANSSAMI